MHSQMTLKHSSSCLENFTPHPPLQFSLWVWVCVCVFLPKPDLIKYLTLGIDLHVGEHHCWALVASRPYWLLTLTRSLSLRPSEIFRAKHSKIVWTKLTVKTHCKCNLEDHTSPKLLFLIGKQLNSQYYSGAARWCVYPDKINLSII